MPLSPPFDEPAQEAPISALSPPFDEEALAAPGVGQGPPVQIITAALLAFGQGPPAQIITAALLGFGHGPPVQHDTETFPSVGQGPPVQHTTAVNAPLPPPSPPPGPGTPTPIPATGLPFFVFPPVRIARRVASVVEPTVLGRYTGPGYPFGAYESQVLGPKGDVLVIVTSMVNIITTPKGTIPYAPRRGSIVPLLLFEPFTDVTLSLLRYYTAKDLGEQEPRMIVRSVFTERISDLAVSVRPSFQIVGDPIGDVLSAPLTFTKEQTF